MDEHAAYDPGAAAAGTPLRLVALIIARRGQVALLLGERERWQIETGCTFMPLELPGGSAHDGETDPQALERIACARLGPRVGRVAVMAGQWVYGPSAAHAIDRRPADPGPAPQPLIELSRSLPVGEGASIALRPVVVRAYRCAMAGALPGGLLWLGPGALRATMRGMAFSELLARRGVSWVPAEGDTPPGDALVFVPSEYGERYLLRAAAKYGPEAIFGDETIT